MRLIAMRHTLPIFLCLGLALFASAAEPPPKLILQITVDQLRGDLPQRFLGRMGDGGFRYLFDQGGGL